MRYKKNISIMVNSIIQLGRLNQSVQWKIDIRFEVKQLSFQLIKSLMVFIDG